MRDWLLLAVPLPLVLYFLAYPDQLKLIEDWVTNFLH